MTASKRIAWLLATCAASMLAIGAMVSPSGAAAPGTLDALLAAAVARRDERLVVRPPASDIATTESAAQHYTAALHAVEELMQLLGATLASWDPVRHVLSVACHDGWRRLHGDALAAHRWAMAEALAAMQRGARCRDASGLQATGSLFWSHQLRTLALAEVDLRLDEGLAHDAVALWLDMATFALDLDAFVRPDDWTPDEVAALPSAAAELLSRGVERLEDRLPRSVELLDLTRSNVDDLRRALPTDWPWQEVLTSWDHGFDPGERHLAIFAAALRHSAAIDPAEATVAGRDAQWQLFEAVTAAERADSDVVAHWVERARAHERSQRFELAALRSLRIGLAARLGVPLPNLIDPTTDAPFHVEEDGATVVVHREPPCLPRRWIRCP